MLTDETSIGAANDMRVSESGDALLALPRRTGDALVHLEPDSGRGK